MSEPSVQWLTRFFKRHFPAGPAQKLQVKGWVDAFIADRARLPDNVPRDVQDLTEANDLLRSAYQIAIREGVNTNWEAFQTRLEEVLVKQSKQLFGTEHPPAAVCTPKTFRRIQLED